MDEMMNTKQIMDRMEEIDAHVFTQCAVSFDMVMMGPRLFHTCEAFSVFSSRRDLSSGRDVVVFRARVVILNLTMEPWYVGLYAHGHELYLGDVASRRERRMLRSELEFRSGMVRHDRVTPRGVG
jgi:hypothetical protein